MTWGGYVAAIPNYRMFSDIGLIHDLSCILSVSCRVSLNGVNSAVL